MRIAIKEKNIYLHIGVPKTASKTIQRGLTDYKSRLARDGYLYPKAGWRTSSHKNIFFELSEIQAQREKFLETFGTLDQLGKEIQQSKSRNFIISSESFALFTKREIKNLRKGLPYRTKVIVYLRRQDQVIQSGWTQNMKRFVVKDDLDTYVHNYLKNKSTCYNYDHLINIWQGVFEKENIFPRVFERSQLSGHIFHDFLETCGLENPTDYPTPKAENIGPTRKFLGFCHAVSQELDFSKIDGLTRRYLGRALERKTNELGWDDGKKFNAIDYLLYSKIQNHYGPGNQLIAQEFFDRSELFLEDYSEKAISNPSLIDIPQKDLITLISHISNNFISSRSQTKRN